MKRKILYCIVVFLAVQASFLAFFWLSGEPWARGESAAATFVVSIMVGIMVTRIIYSEITEQEKKK